MILLPKELQDDCLKKG